VRGLFSGVWGKVLVGVFFLWVLCIVGLVWCFWMLRGDVSAEQVVRVCSGIVFSIVPIIFSFLWCRERW